MHQRIAQTFELIEGLADRLLLRASRPDPELLDIKCHAARGKINALAAAGEPCRCQLCLSTVEAELTAD